jgi:hypothetical protein
VFIPLSHDPVDQLRVGQALFSAVPGEDFELAQSLDIPGVRGRYSLSQ